MKRLFCILLLFLSLSISAQDSPSPSRKHSLYFEAGGNGGIYSLNYERRFSFLQEQQLSWSAGFSILPMFKAGRSIVDFPAGVHWRIGEGKHKAELGTGQVLILDLGGGKGGTIRGTMRLGYCFEPVDKRYYLRFAYTPFYSYIYNFQYENWFGVSYGYYFKN